MSETKSGRELDAGSDLDDDVALFQILRKRLVARLDQREEDLRSSLKKAQEAKRDILGRGARGSASAPGDGTHGDRVLAWLRANPGRRAIAEIAAGTGLERLQVNQVLIALHGARLVRRPARGLYEAAPAGPPLLPAHRAESTPTVHPSAEEPRRLETPADRMRRMQKARGA